MTRWRDLAGPVGLFPTGARNAITDVPGVRVGHAQAGSGEATGVSVVVPPRLPARAGVNTVNGVGELTKKLEIDEWGIIQSPVWLCGTHAVGTVYHGAMLAAGGDPDNTVIPVVGECDDSDMGDARTVTVDDVNAALANAGQEVAEGTVGSGTGMTCFDFPGGIGTASRIVDGHTVGVLLMCNFGDRERPEPPEGSCIAVCATDAPLEAQQLRRLSLRPLLGLARAGSYASNGSGEIGVAFTVAEDEDFPLERLSPLFAAAYEAAEEAVYNCLVAARPARRRNGKMQDEFPVHLVRRGA
jgi:D-aminopeptidase